MIELRTALQSYLKTLHPRVYFKEAHEDAVFPYIIYDFPNSLDDGEGFENIVVDIDGWDSNNTGDTIAIETLMDTINGKLDESGNATGLNKNTIKTDNLAITFYIENKMSLTDDDKRIKRRKYTYSGRMIRRE